VDGCVASTTKTSARSVRLGKNIYGGYGERRQNAWSSQGQILARTSTHNEATNDNKQGEARRHTKLASPS
jgi:hypothetical protein